MTATQPFLRTVSSDDYPKTDQPFGRAAQAASSYTFVNITFRLGRGERILDFIGVWGRPIRSSQCWEAS